MNRTVEEAVRKISYNIGDPEHKRFPEFEILDWLDDVIKEIYEYCKIFQRDIEISIHNNVRFTLPEDFIAIVPDGIRLQKIILEKVVKENVLKYKTSTGLKDLGVAEAVDMSEYYYKYETEIGLTGKMIERMYLHPPLKSTQDIYLYLRYYSLPPFNLENIEHLPVPLEFFSVVVDGATATGMEKKGDKESAYKFSTLFKQGLEIKRRQYMFKFYGDSEKGGRIRYR